MLMLFDALMVTIVIAEPKKNQPNCCKHEGNSQAERACDHGIVGYRLPVELKIKDSDIDGCSVRSLKQQERCWESNNAS